MKKFSKNILIAVCSFIVCLTFAASGCADGNDGKPENGGIVSYVSQQTEVYSSTAEVVEAVADTVSSPLSNEQAVTPITIAAVHTIFHNFFIFYFSPFPYPCLTRLPSPAL